jgi:hypothetical protein
MCGDQKNVGRGYNRLSYMVIKGTNTFTWGEKEDLHVTCNEDIILRAVKPEPVNSRGHLGLNKKDFVVVVVSRVVVVYPFFSVLAKGKAGGNFFFYKFFIMSFNAYFFSTYVKTNRPQPFLFRLSSRNELVIQTSNLIPVPSIPM